MKTNTFTALFLPVAMLLLSLTHSFSSRAQHLILGQDSAFPLYSKIDTAQFKKYKSAFDFEKFNFARIQALRKTLQAKLPDQDPLIDFLYAASMDLYPYGHGKPKEASIALTYYSKAADKGLALAEKMLFDIYRYGLMEQPRDEQKALLYWQRVLQHGDASYKAKAYADMATFF